MNHQQVMEKLEVIFHELFDDDTIVLKDSTTASDIEDWDSLTHMELIATIEDEFEIHFNLGEINSFENVGALVESIIKHMGK